MTTCILLNYNAEPVFVTDDEKLADHIHLASGYQTPVFLLTARTETQANLIALGAEATFPGIEWVVNFTGRHNGLWAVEPV